MNVILLFPGQGSQKPGMGKDLAAAFPAAHDAFQQIDDALGFALSTLCFNGPSDELTLTSNAQPALFAHGAAAWAVVKEVVADRIVAAAGHSLGELTAHHAAGSLARDAGARLVRTRGEIMFDIGSARPGTMAASHPDALYVELGPGNVLCGLVSRIIPGARTVAVGAPADVDRLVEKLAETSA